MRAMCVGRAWLMWSIPAGLFLVAFFHRNAPGVTIYMGAGAAPTYSPTRLTADIVSC